MNHGVDNFPRCDHNPAVLCSEKKCDSCGWNPVVAEERRRKILEAHYGTDNKSQKES